MKRKKTHSITDEELKIMLKKYYEEELKLMNKRYKLMDMETYIRTVYEKAETMPPMKPIKMKPKKTIFEIIKSLLIFKIV